MAFLNTKYSHRGDPHGNGDIERDIMALLTSGADVYNLVETDGRWDVYRHLSPAREAILSWYTFGEDSSLLEIGAGAGALTGLFCGKCRRVVAQERSLERAKIIHERHRERDNLEILAGHFEDMVFEERFDYITMIDVFEYADNFIDSPDPQKDFLQKVKGLLKPGGKLLLATPNRFGLKYWCGAAEDRQCVPFAGIKGYQASYPGKTFDKKSLADLLHNAGFERQKFYYPLPNHTIPRVIFTDDYPYNASVNWKMLRFYLPGGVIVANEQDLWKDLAANRVSSFFANSFLVEAGVCDIVHNEVIFASMDFFRRPEYALHTVIKKNGTVEKVPSSSAAVNHLQTIIKNTEQLSRKGISVIACRIADNKIVSTFSAKPLLLDVLVDSLRADKFPEAIHYLERLRDCICRSSEHVAAELNALYQTETAPKEMAFGPVLKRGFVDMAPHNCLVDGEDLVFFDQEWALPNLPVEYIVLHCIYITASGLSAEECAHWMPKMLRYFDFYTEKVVCLDRFREQYVNGPVHRASEFDHVIRHSLLEEDLLENRLNPKNNSEQAVAKHSRARQAVAAPLQKVIRLLFSPVRKIRKALSWRKKHVENRSR